jgi:hypothetical protein
LSYLFLATEDELSEAVGVKLVQTLVAEGVHITSIRGRGFGGLRRRATNFVAMADKAPVVLLTDLDVRNCASELKLDWFGERALPEALKFRVAVREVEAWLLADRRGFASYLGISEARVPREPEAIADPKQAIVRLAARARREIRDAICPEPRSKSKQGLGYNSTLVPFVSDRWSVSYAADHSRSLSKAISRIGELAKLPQFKKAN